MNKIEIVERVAIKAHGKWAHMKRGRMEDAEAVLTAAGYWELLQERNELREAVNVLWEITKRASTLSSIFAVYEHYEIESEPLFNEIDELIKQIPRKTVKNAIIKVGAENVK